MVTEAQLNALMHDPEKRLRKGHYNEAMVCAFLRNEPYSTAPVIAQWLRMGTHGARRVLKRMVEKELVIRDEVAWMESRKLQIFGISTIGRYAYLGDPCLPVQELDPPQREFRRGRVSHFLVEHTLMAQRCRIELMYEAIHEYIDEEGEAVEPPFWMSESQMPGQAEKKVSGLRWSVYPDGVCQEFVQDPEGDGHFIVRKAVEAERTSKHKKTYVDVLKAHRQNIAADRYHEVLYFVKASLVNSYERTFQAIDPECQDYLSVRPAPM